MPIKDGAACPGCGLPNYSGLCPVCRADGDAYEQELAVALGPWGEREMIAPLAHFPSTPPSPGASGAPNPDLPRDRGKVAAVDGLTTVGEELEP